MMRMTVTVADGSRRGCGEKEDAVVRGIGFWPRATVILVKPLLNVVTQRDWQGMDRIPSSGGVILAANHMSEFDPFVVAHFVYDAGRWPQYLAKSSLFRIPLLGPMIKAVRQIPVERGTIDASKALDAAVTAVRRGEGVIIYPEGTTPKSGDLWPQRGKTGIARLFLATGAPVIPIATWGAQQIFDPRTRKLRLRPRQHVTVVAGDEIDLSRWKGAEPTAANLYAITDEIMLKLREMVGRIRDETPPPAPSSAGRRAFAAINPAATERLVDEAVPLVDEAEPLVDEARPVDSADRATGLSGPDAS
jgi:1-acyl-sn-glycerol-3-phosphate acyltransferase